MEAVDAQWCAVVGVSDALDGPVANPTPLITPRKGYGQVLRLKHAACLVSSALLP